MRLLCGVDDSTSSRDAAHFAARLARALRAELTLMRVAAPGVMPAAARTTASRSSLAVEMANIEARAARRDLDALADDVAATVGIRARVRVDTGKPAEALLAVANAMEHDLVVIGPARRGRLAEALRTGTRARLVEGARCPVLTVPPNAAFGSVRVVAAYEGPVPAPDLLGVSARLASALRAGITFVNVLTNPRAHPGPAWSVVSGARRDIEAALDADVDDVEHVTAYGRPAGDLRRTLAEIAPAIVVTSGEPRSRWRSLLRPPLSDRLVRDAVHPVLSVSPGASGLASPSVACPPDYRLPASAAVAARSTAR